MANDRLFIRCTTCGGYDMLGKFYPGGSDGILDGGMSALKLARFVDWHFSKCQRADHDIEGPVCLTFDSEQTLFEAIKAIGGDALCFTGNINSDKAKMTQNGGAT